MNNIFFTSNEKSTDHIISFTITNQVKDKFTNIYKNEAKKKNLLVIDKYFDLFNSHSDNFVVDKNYEIIDDNHMNIAVLFKHVFRNFKEKQKYIKCVVSHNDNSIIFVMKPNLKVFMKIPSKSEILPVSRMVFKIDEDEDDTTDEVVKCTVEFSTIASISEYPNFDMTVVFIKKLINDTITRLMEL